VHRLSQVLPAGEFDRADGAAVDLPAISVHVAPQSLGDDLDLERVHPDVEVAQLVNGGLDRPSEAVGSAFTDAVDARVGLDFRKQPIFPRITDEVGLAFGDFHANGKV